VEEKEDNSFGLQLILAAMYDFMGHLTTVDKKIVCGSKYHPGDLIAEFSEFLEKRGIESDFDPELIKYWQDIFKN